MKVVLSAGAIALAALATAACGANASSGNVSAAAGNASGTSAAVVSWEGSSGETAAAALEDFFGPATLNDATVNATTQYQHDARNIRGDLSRMKKNPPPADTSEWDDAIAIYSTAVAYLNSGNSSAAAAKLNAGSMTIVAFGNAVDDPDLQA
jgi:hypothetical protein